MTDAVAILLCLHGNLLRKMAKAAGMHFQGLRAAASCLRKRGAITSQMAKKLGRVDDAAALCRHLTEVSANNFLGDIERCLDVYAGGQLAEADEGAKEGKVECEVTQQLMLPMAELLTWVRAQGVPSDWLDEVWSMEMQQWQKQRLGVEKVTQIIDQAARHQTLVAYSDDEQAQDARIIASKHAVLNTKAMRLGIDLMEAAMIGRDEAADELEAKELKAENAEDSIDEAQLRAWAAQAEPHLVAPEEEIAGGIHGFLGALAAVAAPLKDMRSTGVSAPCTPEKLQRPARGLHTQRGKGAVDAGGRTQSEQVKFGSIPSEHGEEGDVAGGPGQNKLQWQQPVGKASHVGAHGPGPP